MILQLLLLFTYFSTLTLQQSTVTLYSDLVSGSYSGWSYVDSGLPVSSSSCGGSYTVLGGVGLSPESIKKSYPLSANYADIIVTFDFLRIDNWDAGEKLIINVNGDLKTFDIDIHAFPVATNLCGTTTATNPVATFSKTVSLPCGTTSLDIIFVATTRYNTLYRDESYGLMNLQITATTCPTGCTCCQNLASGFKCLTCDTTNQYVLNTVTNVCQPCDISCNLCQYLTTNCLSCAVGYYRNPNGGQCITSCPNYYRQGATNCEPCDDPFCLQCPAATGICTQCNSTSFHYGPLNKCVVQCPDKYYHNTAFRYCQLCTDSNCLSCTAGIGICDRCPNTYVIHPTLKTCVASCPSGYMTNYLSGTCDRCTDLNCLSCPNSISVCKQCSLSTYLLGSACVGSCPSGYATSLITNECIQCLDVNCNNCTRASLVCVQCKSNYFFYRQTQTCLSVCPSGYQSNLVTRSCRECLDSSCSTCQFSTSVCEACKSGKYLHPNGNCIDACPVGYWTNSTGRSCVACSDPFCSSCSTSKYKCDNCITNYFYHKTLKYCLQNTCGDGRRTFLTIGGNETCDDGNTVSGDGCSSTCQNEIGYYCSGGDDTHKDTCTYYPSNYSSPNATLYYNRFKADEFVIYFDLDVVFTQPLSNLFYIDILNDQGYQSYSSFTVSQMAASEDYNTRLLVKMNFNQTFDNYTLNIRVLDRSYIQSASGGIYTSEYVLTLEYVSYAYDMQSKLDSAARFEPVSNGFLLAALVSAFVEFLTGDFILFFNFMDTLQEISYLQLMNLQIPLNCLPYFAEYDVGRYSFLYNYFKDIDITPDQWFYSPPGFKRYGMPTLFFYNVGTMLFMWSIIVGAYLLALFLSKYMYKEIRFLRRIRENAGEYFYNLYRTTVVEFTLAIVLQLSNITFDIWYVGFSSALAIIFTIALYTSPGIVMAGMAQNRIKIRNELVRNDTYFIYRDLKTDNFWSRNFWVLYLSKRIIFGTLLGTLGNSPTVNVSLCTVVIVAEYAYIWTVFPFKTYSKNLKFIFMKTMVLLMYLINLGISVSEIKASLYSSFNFGWAMIVFMQLFIFCEIIVTWYYIYKNAGPKVFSGNPRGSTFAPVMAMFDGVSPKKVAPIPMAKKVSKSQFKLDESEMDQMT